METFQRPVICGKCSAALSCLSSLQKNVSGNLIAEFFISLDSTNWLTGFHWTKVVETNKSKSSSSCAGLAMWVLWIWKQRRRKFSCFVHWPASRCAQWWPLPAQTEWRRLSELRGHASCFLRGHFWQYERYYRGLWIALFKHTAGKIPTVIVYQKLEATLVVAKRVLAWFKSL